MHSTYYRLGWGCFFLLVFSMTSCSVNQTLKKPESGGELLQQASQSDPLAHPYSETPVRAETHLHLGTLYVNHKKPQTDYPRALQEMETYLSLAPDKAQTEDFQNWLRALREMDHLRRDRAQMAEKNRAMQGRIEKLQTSLDKVQEENRGLRNTLASLQEKYDKMSETIKRLKTLDQQMEEKRGLIK